VGAGGNQPVLDREHGAGSLDVEEARDDLGV
jgi:hypothetical protein